MKSKQETDQTVLTIAKALAKTTNCTFRAKKWRGTTKTFSPAFCAGPVPPPHFQIRSGASAFLPPTPIFLLPFLFPYLPVPLSPAITCTPSLDKNNNITLSHQGFFLWSKNG